MLRQRRVTTRASDRNTVVRYVVQEHFRGDVARVCEATGFTKQQVTTWLDGTRTPHSSNVAYLMHHAFAPAFSIISEYQRIEHDGTTSGVRKQLAALLSGHETASGIYAFYDSMANLIYLGKSDGNLLAEAYQQLCAEIKSHPFPRGAPQPTTRLEVVQYVSAYQVSKSAFEDYAKHVESLILRISKPILNTNVGKLENA